MLTVSFPLLKMSEHSESSSRKRAGDGDNEEDLPSKTPRLSLTPDDFREIARQVASIMGAQLPPSGNQEQPGSDHGLPPTNVPLVEPPVGEAGEVQKDPPLSLHPNGTIDGGETSQTQHGARRSEYSCNSRVEEDFAEGEQISSETDKAFKSTLKLLAEVLGDRLPTRTIPTLGIQSQSDRGDDLHQHKEVRCFPHSGLIATSFSVMSQFMTGESAPDMSDPSVVPDYLNSKVLSSKSGGVRIPSYNDRYYMHRDDTFTSKAPDVDHLLETHAFGKRNDSWKDSKTVSAKQVADAEVRIRRALAATSSIDILVDAIRTLTDSLGLSNNEGLNELFSSLTRSIAHSAAHNAHAISLCMLLRRSAFLEKAGEKVPEALHEWMKCQPFLPPDGKKASLFGNVTGKVQEYKLKEDKAAANEAVAQFRPPQLPRRQDDRRRHNGGGRGSHRAPSATYTPTSQGRGSGNRDNYKSGGTKRGHQFPSGTRASRGARR